MGGKYEIRFRSNTGRGYETIFTDSWIEFIKIRITKKWIYFKICN